MSTLGNFVELVPGRPKALRFSMIYLEDRTVKDSISGVPKQARAVVGQVIAEDGIAVNKQFSTLSSKLARVILPYMIDLELSKRTFTILKDGTGFNTEYRVSVS